MKVTVFGGSGFLGSFVADELTQSGFDVTIFDKKPSPYIKSNQKMLVGDILTSNLEEALRGQDYVYNFAGLADLNASFSQPVAAVSQNILGNTLILEACRKNKIKRFVYASTVYVFSQHGSFYGVSKYCAEKLIEEYQKEYSLPFTIVRYGSVYGRRADEQNRIFRLLRQALEKKKIVFQGNGEEEREYIHVEDAAKLSVDVLMKPEFENQHVVFTGFERFKYSQLLSMIKEVFNDEIEIEYLNQNYRGHYTYTPYSFRPTASKKIMSHSYIDFGQGLLDTIHDVHQRMKDVDC